MANLPPPPTTAPATEPIMRLDSPPSALPPMGSRGSPSLVAVRTCWPNLASNLSTWDTGKDRCPPGDDRQAPAGQPHELLKSNPLGSLPHGSPEDRQEG